MNIDERFMKAILSVMKDENNVTLDQKFKDMNISSIIYIRLIITIEEEFGFEFDDEMLVCKPNFCLRDILNYIQKKCMNRNKE